MKNEKGISPWVILLIVVLFIVAGIVWSKYFAEPTATVMLQGADQAKPALEKAHQTSDTATQAVRAAEEATSKMNEGAEKQQE